MDSSQFTPDIRFPCDGPTITSAAVHPENSICVAGLVFLDVVMVGLQHAPRPGEEQWVPECQMMPGGVAIQAVSLARLGAPTTLVAQLGQDPAGGIVAEMLTCEDVDTTYATFSARQAVTTSLAFNGDRAMTTYGEEYVPPLSSVATPPAGLVCDMRTVKSNRDTLAAWRSGSAPTWVLADVGFDPVGVWNPEDISDLDMVDVFTPNAVEAMRYTRTQSIEDAARELSKNVMLVIITRGEDGIYARLRDEVIEMPAITEAPVVDPTGAGDSFAAGLCWSMLNGLPVRQGLALGTLAAAFSIGQPGGSAFSPTLQELIEWSHTVEIPPEINLEFLETYYTATSQRKSKEEQ
ncbi:MAG: carbohydrate kinase family protein [Canibacter sp.]